MKTTWIFAFCFASSIFFSLSSVFIFVISVSDQIPLCKSIQSIFKPQQEFLSSKRVVVSAHDLLFRSTNFVYPTQYTTVPLTSRVLLCFCVNWALWLCLALNGVPDVAHVGTKRWNIQNIHFDLPELKATTRHVTCSVQTHGMGSGCIGEILFFWTVLFYSFCSVGLKAKHSKEKTAILLCFEM